ncbi:TMN3 [Symbiodinium sp. KB8]|nr:TMN3 [Symbiodinium sp. KB8]
MRGLWAVLASAALASCIIGAAAKSRKYERLDPVPVVANKVGPFANPTEIYKYYSLPFCRPSTLKGEEHAMGEYLSGDRRVNTPYDIRYRVAEEWRELCSVDLTAAQVDELIVAIEQEYYFELFMDDLPLWGYVGEVVEDLAFMTGGQSVDRYFIFPHLHFAVSYNDDRVISVNVTTDTTKRKQLVAGVEPQQVRFSYSVSWHATEMTFDERQAHLLEGAGLFTANMEIHWLSIINAAALVLLLIAFLCVVLVRVVRNDLTAFLQEEDDIGDDDAVRWKHLHADVFRPPTMPNFYASLVGTGAHLFTTVVLILAMAMAGMFKYSRRGAMLSTAILAYAFSAPVGGFVSGQLYKQLGGTAWVWNTMTTAGIFPLPLLCTFAVLNTTAFAHASIAALPIGTIFMVVAIYFVFAFPLTVLGAIAGKNSTPWVAPGRTNKVRREIPALPWYRSPLLAQVVMGGLLPFSAISVEVHFIFAAMWGHRVYTLFGILLIAVGLFTLVAAFVSIALTYYQLANEDWQWWWRPVLSGISGGCCVMAYAAWYFFSHSEMSGFLQTSFFFGYTALCAFGFALMQAFVSYLASVLFVRYIYSQSRSE